jgi:hypothetical protein
MTLCLRKQQLEWRQIDDEIVALDTEDSVYLAARGSGALLWRLLGESTTRDRMVEALLEAYGIDATRAAEDVDGFLATLDARGLLTQ